MLLRKVLKIMILGTLLVLTACMDKDDTEIVQRDATGGTAPVTGPPAIPPSGDYISDPSCFRIMDVFQAPPMVCYRGADLNTAYGGSIPSVFGATCSAASPVCCEPDIFRIPDLNLLKTISEGSAYTPILNEVGTDVNAAGAGQTGMVKMLFLLTENYVEPAVENLYQALAGPGGPYRGITRSLCVLAIMFFAGSIMLGMTHANPYVFFLLSMKIFCVWVFATDWDMFDDYIMQFFNDGIVEDLSSQIIASVTNESATGYSVHTRFEQIDGMISMFFSAKFFMLIAALLMNWPSGPILAILLFVLLFTYLSLVLKALKLYLMAYFARALIFATAPIFIPFLLMKQTSSIFVGWYTQLINYSLQPLFAMTLLSMFHLILLAYVQSSGMISDETAQICVRPIFSFHGIIDIGHKYAVCNGNGAEFGSDEANAELPLNLWVIVSLILLCWLMRQMFDWSVEIAARLSGGIDAAVNVPIRGWESMKQQGLRGASRVAGGAVGGVVGARSGSGFSGSVRRHGGIVGALQGRGTVGDGIRTRAAMAGRRQDNRAYQAMYGELFGKAPTSSPYANSVGRKGVD